MHATRALQKRDVAHKRNLLTCAYPSLCLSLSSKKWKGRPCSQARTIRCHLACTHTHMHMRVRSPWRSSSSPALATVLGPPDRSRLLRTSGWIKVSCAVLVAICKKFEECCLCKGTQNADVCVVCLLGGGGTLCLWYVLV